MFDLRQNEAITLSFFLHDADGDPVLTKVDGDFTKSIKKQGGSLGAFSTTITEDAKGWYDYTVATGDVDTSGFVYFVFEVSGAKQVNQQYRVVVKFPEDFAPVVLEGPIEVEVEDN